jgi:hypothetical protein
MTAPRAHATAPKTISPRESGAFVQFEFVPRLAFPSSNPWRSSDTSSCRYGRCGFALPVRVSVGSVDRSRIGRAWLERLCDSSGGAFKYRRAWLCLARAYWSENSPPQDRTNRGRAISGQKAGPFPVVLSLLAGDINPPSLTCEYGCPVIGRRTLPAAVLSCLLVVYKPSQSEAERRDYFSTV